jgi:hypothetical protein
LTASEQRLAARRPTSIEAAKSIQARAALGASQCGTAGPRHSSSSKFISSPSATKRKTPPRDRGGVFRGSAGASTPAEHSHDNVQSGLEFRRGRCRYLRVAGLLGLFMSLRLLGSYF